MYISKLVIKSEKNKKYIYMRNTRRFYMNRHYHERMQEKLDQLKNADRPGSIRAKDHLRQFPNINTCLNSCIRFK